MPSAASRFRWASGRAGGPATATNVFCHGRVLNDCRTRAPPSDAVTRPMTSGAMMPS